ncbi:MAG: hypothetical protein LBH90_06135 [Tannerella sp.]|jgi:multidrug efflux pump subunit AcrA (membrane-fusion protein)|nr:hypothetical protein [Tannerella sp.]
MKSYKLSGYSCRYFLDYLDTPSYFTCLLIFMTGCGKKEIRETAKIIPVKIETVELSSEAHYCNYAGAVEESFALRLSFSGTGTVESVRVTEGQPVAAGQLFALLSSVSVAERDRFAVEIYLPQDSPLAKTAAVVLTALNRFWRKTPASWQSPFLLTKVRPVFM